MGPVVDGKYSIDAYMQCIDACYQAMRRKMNDCDLLQLTDYNVFHTGGGYHVVRKAFERLLRCETPGADQQLREAMSSKKLDPSVRLLKLIGPCHTVSSFLNISSVAMGEWDKAIGKVTLVFTYGSGSASSMYMLRHDDVPYMPPFNKWKISFMRNAIHQHPSTQIHEFYGETWQLFDFKPKGRESCGHGIETLEKNTYYLMEIDPWGRRFYHRGGLAAGPLDDKYVVDSDKKELRHMRQHYGEVPEVKDEEPEKEKELTKEERWRKLEYDMVYEVDEEAEYDVMEEAYVKGHTESKTLVVAYKSREEEQYIENDGLDHSYQIVGSWGKYQKEDMEKMADGSFTFELTLGANSWEMFHLIQDNDENKKIYPAYKRSFRDSPCVGPHHGGNGHLWLLEGREGKSMLPDDHGMPGDHYVVTFSWAPGRLKELSWVKADVVSPWVDDGTYHMVASWACGDLVQLEPDPEKKGSYNFETQMTSLGIYFYILRNEDTHQRIYPDVPLKKYGQSGDYVLGVDEDRPYFSSWKVNGDLGDIFQITFTRSFTELEELELTWKKINHKPVEEPALRYFLVGTCNNWSRNGFLELTKLKSKDAYTCEVVLSDKTENFQILEYKLWSRCIKPDKKECSQQQSHQITKTDETNGTDHEFCWTIGKALADKARIGHKFTVTLETDPKLHVSWKRAEE